MGLNVLLLADSTSRLAQAMREMSGRLEEIPGEEAFPAYLESVIASFYERAGVVRLKDGSMGSVTIGGTVSPAGGNFEEPVTQATLKVVGAFHGLSRERSDARKYPAIHPLESWSKYKGSVNKEMTEYGRDILFRGNDVAQMMKVVGEEGTSLEDYVLYLKSDFLDDVYLQQDSFDPVDAAVSIERQQYVYNLIFEVLSAIFDLNTKEDARKYFNQLRQKFRDWNGKEWDSDEFKAQEQDIRNLIAEKKRGIEERAQEILKKLAG
jgi:V/A-type H+-transporting ATPase subunit A